MDGRRDEKGGKATKLYPSVLNEMMRYSIEERVHHRLARGTGQIGVQIGYAFYKFGLDH